MSGMLEGGLLASAEKQAVTFSDSKTWLQAFRSANPQSRRAGNRPSNPIASAMLNTSPPLTRCFVKPCHESSREAVSSLSLGTKYGESDADLTLGGSAGTLALFLAWTNRK